MTTLEHYAEINPFVTGVARASQEQVAFVPMAAVSEEGRLEVHETRPLAEVAKGYTCFARGDVLMAKITPCMENGKAALISNLSTEIGFGSTEFHVLRPRPGVDERFLFYLVWNQRFREEAAKHMSGSAGQKRVPASYLRQAKVPLLAPNEQRRIADLLDKADAIRRKRKEAIALTEELLRSAFLEMFGDPVTNPKGWPVSVVEDLCCTIVDCPHTTPKYGGEERPHPCVRTSDLQGGFFDWSTTKYVSAEEYQERIARLKPLAGDVLYTREGERYGIAAVLPEGIAACLGQRMMLLRPEPTVSTSEFLWALMNSSAVYQQATAEVGGSTSPHVNVKSIRRFRVVRPPLPLQVAYSRIYHTAARSRSQGLSALGEAEVLFGSLVHASFGRGEAAKETQC